MAARASTSSSYSVVLKGTTAHLPDGRLCRLKSQFERVSDAADLPLTGRSEEALPVGVGRLALEGDGRRPDCLGPGRVGDVLYGKTKTSLPPECPERGLSFDSRAVCGCGRVRPRPADPACPALSQPCV